MINTMLKTMTTLCFTMMLLLLLTIMAITTATHVNSEYVQLYPSTHVTTKGSHSTDQPISVFQSYDLSGTSDNWNTYRELYPKRRQSYVGTFEFNLGSGAYNPTTQPIESIQLKANVRGEPYNRQKWWFYVEDASTGAWMDIMNNQVATSWVWSELNGNLNVPNENLCMYLTGNCSGPIKVHLQSNNARDVLNLDFLQLTLVPGTTPTTDAPTKSPTSSPTKSPTTFPTKSPTTSPTNAPVTKSPTKSPTSSPTEPCVSEPSLPNGILIPLYIWPLIDTTTYECIEPSWLAVGNSPVATSTIAVANPQNGPPQDPWQLLCYQSCVGYLKSKGVTVIGYVATKIGYGTPEGITGYRPLADVQQDISSWSTVFDTTSTPNLKVDGIFVDEVSNAWPDPSFDSETQIIAFNHAVISHTLGLFTSSSTRIVLNAGSPYFTSLMQPFEGDERIIAIVRETNQSGYSEDCVTGRQPGPFCKYSLSNNPNTVALEQKMTSDVITSKQSAVIIYNSTPTAQATVDNIQYASNSNVGYIYFVDQAPWSTFPSTEVWNAQVNAVVEAASSSGGTGGGCPPPPVPAPVSPPTSAPVPAPVTPPTSAPVKTTLINVLDTFTYDLPNAMTSYSTKVIFRDLEDTSSEQIEQFKSEGHVVICYFSAGSYEDWRSDEASFPSEALGNPLDGWPGERWLDIRHSSLRPIMYNRLEMAVAKGCHGVDPDNVDGFTNDTGFPLTAQDQSTYLTNLSEDAHSLGLLIGLKICDALVSELEPYFDFSTVEECYLYQECSQYFPFKDASKPIFAIEYIENVSYDVAICNEFYGWNFSLHFANYPLTQIIYCPAAP